MPQRCILATNFVYEISVWVTLFLSLNFWHTVLNHSVYFTILTHQRITEKFLTTLSATSVSGDWHRAVHQERVIHRYTFFSDLNFIAFFFFFSAFIIILLRDNYSLHLVCMSACIVNLTYKTILTTTTTNNCAKKKKLFSMQEEKKSIF